MGLLGSGMLLLLKHPEQLDAVRNDFTLIPQMVEEVLRYESPDQWNARTIEVSAGATLGGSHIPDGARLGLAWGSANRDEDVFKHPDQFDIFREDVGKHIAFGFGTHYCIGAALARAEGRIAFERLFTRLADIECQIPLDEVRYRVAPMDRGLESLPIRFVAA
jgi:cytochrome P450